MAKGAELYTNNVKATIKRLGYNIGEVAEEAQIPARTMTNYLNGKATIPRLKLQRISEILGCSIEELRGQDQTNQPNLLSTATETVASQNLEDGTDMNESRRSFLKAVRELASAGIISATASTFSPSAFVLQSRSMNVSESVVSHFSSMTQHYRGLQRAGIDVGSSVKSHIALLQNVLEYTVDDKKRRELWRILAQCQLLVRLSITDERELGRAKTWNEAAIASAQSSGDALLVGAAIGHLAHLKLIWQHDPLAAEQLLDQAHDYSKSHLALNGWFATVSAAVAAKGKNVQRCEALLEEATNAAYKIAGKPKYADAFFTDFGGIGVDAYAGNCFLKSGNPTKALQRLTAMKIDELADNRHATAYYDISCAYSEMGELEETQAYAFQSIDKAIATSRLYIIPRFVNLTNKIKQRYHHEPHALAIVEYINEVSQQIGG